MNRILKEKLDNYYLIEKQKKLRTSVVSGYPYWLTIDPTNICNLGCPFCPTGQRRNSRPSIMMSFKMFKKIIDELGTYLLHIDLCNWGEPLLNKNIYEMIPYAKKFQCSIKIDTNFNVKFDEKDAETMIQTGLDKIIVSLDGASQSTYEIYRRGGDFKKVIENMKLLIKKKKELNAKNPFIQWQFLVFKHNEHEIEKAKNLAKKIEVDLIDFTTPYCAPEWISTIEKYNRYRLEGKKVTFKPGEEICNWLWDGITINADGSVSPCCSVEDKKDDFGELFSKPFFLFWNSKNYKVARKYVSDRKKPGNNNICTICDHIGISNHKEIKIVKNENSA